MATTTTTAITQPLSHLNDIPTLDFYPTSTEPSQHILDCLYSIRTLTRTITCLKFSKCGFYFAAASADSIVEIYSISGKPIYRLFGLHSHGINSLAWSPCSNYIALACDDGFVTIWNIHEQLPLLILRAHVHHVLSVAWSPTGSLIGSGGADGSVCVFDVASGSLLRQWEAHNDLVRSVDFSSDGTMVISSSNDGTIRYWDNSSGFCLKTLQQGAKVGYGQLSIAPQTDLLVAVGCLDGCVRVYDAILGTCVMLLVGHVNTQYSLPLTYVNQPLPSDEEAFYNDLHNLDQVPFDCMTINSTQESFLYHMNDLNQFLSQELHHLEFQQHVDGNDSNDSNNNNISTTTMHQQQKQAQQQPTAIQQQLPPSVLPPTHSIINRHSILTPTGALIQTTNPIIDPKLNTMQFPYDIPLFDYSRTPTSSTPTELTASLSLPIAPFTRLTPSIPIKPSMLSTVQSFRELEFKFKQNGTTTILADVNNNSITSLALALKHAPKSTHQSSTTTTSTGTTATTNANNLSTAKTTPTTSSPPQQSNTSPIKPTEQVVTRLTMPYDHIAVQHREKLRQVVSRQVTKMLVSGSEDGGICFWNLQTLDEQQQINQSRQDQGKPLLDIVVPGQLVYKLRAHHDVVSALDCHPYLPLIVSGGMDHDSCVKMWLLSPPSAANQSK